MSIADDRVDLFGDFEGPKRAERNLEAKRGYASAQSPTVSPEGTVWVPELGTYVDADVMADVVNEDNNGGVSNGNFEGYRYDDGYDDSHSENHTRRAEHGPEQEPSDEDHTSERSGGDHRSRSETLDQMVQSAGHQTSASVIEDLAGGDWNGAVNGASGALGVDPQGAASLIEMTVEEAKPAIESKIGGAAFQSIVYAATATEDPMARRVLTDMVRGAIPQELLGKAYNLWVQSLPGGEYHERRR